MTRLLIIPALILAVAASACVANARLGARTGTSMSPPVDAPTPMPQAGQDPGPGHAPDEDEHWFTSEDYLVSKQPYEGSPRLWLRLGKMMAQPTAETRAEARFLLANGHELWSAHYWRTRVASERDLSLGALVFCPQGGGRAPDTKQRSRRARWLLGAITDLSDLYKGLIAIGNRDCEVRALRVPIE